MTEEKHSSPGNHWRRRAKTNPLPHDQAVRQGEITGAAFRALGREQAIAFLNEENVALGARPIALATQSAAGLRLVEAELISRAGTTGDMDPQTN